MNKYEFYAKWVLRVGIGLAAIYDLFILNWVGIAGGFAVLLSTFLIDYINKKFIEYLHVYPSNLKIRLIYVLFIIEQMKNCFMALN